MNPFECPHEAEVQQALRTSQWPDPLQVHAQACPVCSEVAAMHRAFQSVALATREEAVVPHFRSVLIEAEWQQRKETQRQMLRTERRMRWGTVAAFTLIVTGVMLALGRFPVPGNVWSTGSVLLPIALVWILIERPFIIKSHGKVFL